MRKDHCISPKNAVQNWSYFILCNPIKSNLANTLNSMNEFNPDKIVRATTPNKSRMPCKNVQVTKTASSLDATPATHIVVIKFKLNVIIRTSF